MKDLKPQWDNLTRAEQTALAQQAAGKNQFDVFTAVMRNYAKAVEATETAYNSQGSASRENEKVLDSMKGHLQQLASAWEYFSYKMVSSDFLKSIVDAGTTILKGFATPVGQSLVKLALMTAPIALLTRGMVKFSAAVKGMTALEALSSLFLGSARAATIDSAATDKDTASKLRNAQATRVQNAANARFVRGKAVMGSYGARASAAGTYAMPVGGMKKVGQSATVATKATKTLGATIKGAGKSLLAFVGLNPWVAAIAGTAALIYAVNKLSPTFEKEKEKLNEVNTKLSEQKDLIKNLESKNNLTDDEERRLEVLREQTAELEKQQEIQEKNTAKAYENDSKIADPGRAAPGQDPYGAGKTKQSEAINKYRSSLYALIGAENDLKKATTAQQKALKDGDKEAYGKATEDVKKYGKQVSTQKTNVNDAQNEIEKFYKELSQFDYSDLSPEMQKVFGQLKGFSKEFKDGGKEAAKYKELLKDALKPEARGQDDKGTEAFWGTAKNLLNEAGDNADVARKKLADLQSVFDSGSVKGEGFSKAMGDSAIALGEFNEKGDKFSIPLEELDNFSKESGYSKEAIQALDKAMGKNFEIEVKDSTLKDFNNSLKKTEGTMTDTDGKIITTEDNFNKLADQMGYTESQTNQLRKAWVENGNTFVNTSGSLQELQTSLGGATKEFGLAVNEGGKLKEIDVDSFTNKMLEAGEGADTITDHLNQADIAGVKLTKNGKKISFDKAKKSAEEAEAALKKATKGKHEAKIGVKEDKGKGGLKGFLDSLSKASKKKIVANVDVKVKNKKDIETATTALEKIPPETNVAVNIDGHDQIMSAEKAIELLNSSDGKTVTSVLAVKGTGEVEKGNQQQGIMDGWGNVNLTDTLTVNTPGMQAGISGQQTINGMTGKKIDNTITTTIKTVFETVGSAVKAAAKGAKQNAKGKKKGEEGGDSWVGEEGAELVVSKNGAYLAGQDGWELMNLNRDDIVYTAEETKRILSNEDYKEAMGLDLPRFAKGKKKKSRYLNPNKKKKGKQTKQAKKDEKKANKYDKWLETQQYLLDTDQISEATFMKRLTKKIKPKRSTTKDQYREAKKQLHDYKKEVIKNKMEEYNQKAKYDAKGYKSGKAYLDKQRKDGKISKKEYKEMLAELTKAKIEYDMNLVHGNKKTTASMIKDLKAYLKAGKLTLEEYKDAVNEVREYEISQGMKAFDKGTKTYDQMKAQLQAYVKAGEITWEQYYDHLDELAEAAKDKEIARLQKLADAEDAKKQLMSMYVEDQISAIDEQIEALEKQNEVQNKANELAEKEADLARAKNQRVKVYREGVGFIYERDTQAIKEAQSALKDFETQKQVDELEKLKSGWEDVQKNFDKWERKQEQLNLEKTAGKTIEQIIGNIQGANVQELGTLYSVLGANAEGMKDVMEILNNANTVQDIERLLKNGIVNQELLAAWREYNLHNWDLDPNRSKPSTTPTTTNTSTSSSGPNILTSTPNLSNITNQAKKTTVSTTINVKGITLPNVTSASNIAKGLLSVNNKVLQSSAKKK